jgi:hypothetical protein
MSDVQFAVENAISVAMMSQNACSGRDSDGFNEKIERKSRSEIKNSKSHEREESSTRSV